MTQIVNALSDISAQYDALFVDLWGCVHNGVRAFDAANKALIKYRAGGGIVVLVTNSPRPRAQVEQQLADFGVARDAWDSIASSGDSARSALFLGAVGQKIYFIGTDAELPFFEPLKLINDPIQISHVSIEEAEGIVCTGLPTADGTPDDVRAPLLYAKQKEIGRAHV